MYTNPDISLLKLTRKGQITKAPGRYITLMEKDRLLLMCDVETVAKLNETKELNVHQGRLSKENLISDIEDDKETQKKMKILDW